MSDDLIIDVNLSDEQIAALKKLREPFPDNLISQMNRGNVTLDYVGHAAATHRLLDADAEWNWEPFALDARGLPAMDYDQQGNPVGLWIRLTVAGVTRIGYGSVTAGKQDAVKELIGDSLRNAGMRFGLALDLWHKGDLTVEAPPLPADTAAADQAQLIQIYEALSPAGQQRVDQAAAQGGIVSWRTTGVPPERAAKFTDFLSEVYASERAA